jgi:hypothetical protein
MNRISRIPVLLIAGLLTAGWVRADLTAAKAETNLEKRARKALDNAEEMLKAARKSYRTGDWKQTKAALDEVQESVELAFISLKETGKDPRKKPKHFKRAEIKTRKLMRTLKDFALRMSYDERGQIKSIQDYIQKVHDELLEGIMGTGEWEATTT